MAAHPLPPAVQRLFYRHQADRLDTQQHAALVIPTVLADGALDDWHWLFREYGWDAVRDWLLVPSHAESLPPAVQHFWTLMLLGTAQETPRWSGGNGRRAVPPDALPDWFPPELP